ncbi:MAG TPA: rRNA maturation RNase YbeY [Lacipirellulaceae bacterium]|nr:rRNA maturation RNase YbeY [Lacipirellulaceae bacterium]
MDHESEGREQLTRFDISLANQQHTHAVNELQLIEAARAVLRDSEYSSAAISLAVVDDPTIHKLNRRHLNHDWPTDVLSFCLEEQNRHLEGEVVISADMAAAAAKELGNSAGNEQLLYVIHGMLHLIGYDDATSGDKQQMRSAEARYLREFGFAPDAPSDRENTANSAISNGLATRRSAP